MLIQIAVYAAGVALILLQGWLTYRLLTPSEDLSNKGRYLRRFTAKARRHTLRMRRSREEAASQQVAGETCLPARQANSVIDGKRSATRC